VHNVKDRSPQNISKQDAEEFCREYFGIDGRAEHLGRRKGPNFLVRVENTSFVLKVESDVAQRALLDMQNQVMSHLARHPAITVPEVIRDRSGQQVVLHEDEGGRPLLIRLLSYVPGARYAQVASPAPALETKLGAFLGEMDKALADFMHPLAHRYLQWDLHYAQDVINEGIVSLQDPGERQQVESVLARYMAEVLPRTGSLPKGILHHDANDYHVLVDDAANPTEIAGMIDFAKVTHTFRVAEVAIACAYAVQHNPSPLESICRIVAGYHAANPLDESELGSVFHLVCLRLAMSMVHVAQDAQQNPGNDEVTTRQSSTRQALTQLLSMDPITVELTLRRGCHVPGRSPGDLVEDRKRVLSPSLSLSYGDPIKIVRGRGAYLYDEDGHRYLDMVNNVCHVGHCHPQVVAAGQQQMADLNTNTRYLHDGIVDYAERLLATFPEPLSVIMFVNSGSEANELALRLARTHTGCEEVLVVDGAYHGNTQACIDISPYKFDGVGGRGCKPWVHVVDLPDAYRGVHRGWTEETGAQYAEDAAAVIAQLDKPAAYICESLQGVGGQVVMPPGYLAGVYRALRSLGGVCIADEVQVGFGRVGACWWGFQIQDVVPDIVTLGKPMGNGHPLAACVTTREIADSFANGMEYFNTYGGNPVSCAIGSAVLDVIEQEQLMQHARDVGATMLTRLRELQARFPAVGDVRGMGLFLGIELVSDPRELTPATALARHIVEAARQQRILLSTEGPHHNVIKIKPPMVFGPEEAEIFLDFLEGVLMDTEKPA
jgi:4-aminobutyrate aminotransferase-like enzyme/Ser/Thr protein kinase RdoA (MazF antagonist)